MKLPKTMPLPLEILYAIYFLAFIWSLLMIALHPQDFILGGVVFMGYVFAGLPFIAITIFNGILMVVFLYGLWHRYSWAWKYGLAYQMYRTIILLPNVFSSDAILSISALIVIVVNGIFAYFIYNNKKYFNNKAKLLKF
jgi:signal transduction histidine kinase